MSISRRSILCAGLAPVAWSVSAAESDYPNRPIRVVIPYPAGVPLDGFVRVIAQKLQPLLGQPLVVDNRAGAAADIGTELVARSPADGYTLLAFGINFAANPSLFKRLPYDPVKDFVPVIGLIRTSGVLIVAPDSPYHSVADLVERARRDPKALKFASGGKGSMAHFCGELFKSSAGIEALHVPYKGSGDVLNSLLARQTDFAFPVTASCLELIRSGRLRALAVTSAKRMPQLPAVPTMHEALPGKGYDLEADNGIVAPAGTPSAVVARLHAEIAKVLADPGVTGPIVASGYELLASSPAQVRAKLAKDMAIYSAVAKQSGAQAD
jgi:tripartite-type tricarboxylate transporter receptor subunit TctC